MKILKVIWKDSCSSHLNWTLSDELEQEDLSPIQIVSLGILIRDCNDYIVLAQNYGFRPEQMCSLMTIPRGCIKEIIELGELEGAINTVHSDDERDKMMIIDKYAGVSNEEKKKCLAWLEKQREKNTADKVEPTFKVGDWVVLNENHNSTYQVEKIENYHYVLRHILGGIFRIPFDSENSMRLWTIKDTKEGDVIFDKSDNTIGIFKCFGMLPDGGCNNDDSYCYLHCQYDPPYADITLDNEAFSENVVPATKEQRDLLFAKMKEVGYEWDAEKKQLIIITLNK